MIPGRAFAGALVLAAHLLFAPISYAQDGPISRAQDGPKTADAAAQSAGDLSPGSGLSSGALAALIAAGFVPVLVKVARERKQRRHD